MAALVAAFATMVAIHSGVGQVVDVNLIESMLQVMGPLVSLYGVLADPGPLGGGDPLHGAPQHVPDSRRAVGGGVHQRDSVATRVMELIGLGDDERFADFAGRVAHRARWTSAWNAGWRSGPCRRCWTSSTGPTPRRPRSTTWPTSSPTPTTANGG
ncbi:MAG: CoA transferase [Desulfomicrobium escambiense]|nr:CoA transferase [Desulfomicrobium escambiense]